MTFDDLSDDAKLFFMLWGLLGNFGSHYYYDTMTNWRTITSKGHEEARAAWMEVHSFFQACAIAQCEIADQRRKDRERMRRLTG